MGSRVIRYECLAIRYHLAAIREDSLQTGPLYSAVGKLWSIEIE